MDRGRPGFRQDFTCPVLLRIPLSKDVISYTGVSPSMPNLSRLFYYQILVYVVRSYNPTSKLVVCPLTRSLAATSVISIDFSSCGYLDVSVPRVGSINGNTYRYVLGCPIQKFPDQSPLTAPRDLSQPGTSFIASTSQGIHRSLLVAYLF